MQDADVLARLAELGIELPPPPMPVASYVPVVISGSRAHVAGQVPMIDGRVIHPGHLGQDVSIEDATIAARQGALQSLAALRSALESFDRLRRIVSVTVYIAAGPDFIEHPKVANGASDLLVEVLGEAGKHARAAVGVSSLPLGASIEVQLTAEVD
ncbi:MAG: RidA family protein [Actinomycetota bacterium]|nr:RidA family protein [Actinomycetota bacterium]